MLTLHWLVKFQRGRWEGERGWGRGERVNMRGHDQVNHHLYQAEWLPGLVRSLFKGHMGTTVCWTVHWRGWGKDWRNLAADSLSCLLKFAPHELPWIRKWTTQPFQQAKEHITSPIVASALPEPRSGGRVLRPLAGVSNQNSYSKTCDQGS